MEYESDSDVKIYGSEGNAARKLDSSAGFPSLREWVLPDDPMAVTRRLQIALPGKAPERKSFIRMDAHQRFLLTGAVFIAAVLFLLLGALSRLSCEKAVLEADERFQSELLSCETVITRMEGTAVISDSTGNPVGKDNQTGTNHPFRDFSISVFSCLSTLNNRPAAW